MKKIIITLGIFFLLFDALSHKTYARENAKVILINQIRGSELCCQPGGLELIRRINGEKTYNTLPIGWALRFDALNDKAYTDEFISDKKLGLLLEITPSLASVSGVVYKGAPDGSDWYMARNTFLVGYDLPERKKILDTLFGKFKEVFGYYPSFTVSWMIDSWSLGYINKVYGVKLHELTKEQYETDSYTLDGGIFNAPYYPSTIHPLIPGKGNDRLDLVIVRQTVSDLKYNYGSAKALYTSQPNDYLSGKQFDISYFDGLLTDMVNQTNRNKLAVLGLENSSALNQYHDEFLNQLKLVKKYEEEGKAGLIDPSEYAAGFIKNNSQNEAFYLKKDFSFSSNFGVLWYFSSFYRARVTVKDGNSVLEDLRNYSENPDPYRDAKALQDYAFWVMPYLFDISKSSPYLTLGKGEFTLVEKEDRITIRFTKSGKSVQFTPEAIEINTETDSEITTPVNKKILDLFSKESTTAVTGNFEFYTGGTNEKVLLGWQRDGQNIPLFSLEKNAGVIKLSPEKIKGNLKLLNPVFQPDRTDLPFDKDKSIYYWNNREAIAGRNPLRLFIVARNVLEKPAIVESVRVEYASSDPIKTIYPLDYSFRVTPWFIDISSEKPISTKANIYINGIPVQKEIEIKFVYDCKKQISSCLKNPKNLWEYFAVLLRAWVSWK